MFYEVRENIAPSYEQIEMKVDGSNISMFYCPIDPIANQSFVKNYGGYIRNDIQLIAEQEDAAVAADLLSRLSERQSDGKIDVPDDELIQSMMSRRCQTASEVMSYIEGILEKNDLLAEKKFYDDESKKMVEEKKAARQSLWESMTSDEKDVYLKDKRKKEIEDGLNDD